MMNVCSVKLKYTNRSEQNPFVGASSVLFYWNFLFRMFYIEETKFSTKTKFIKIKFNIAKVIGPEWDTSVEC